jgi:predicted signal transduction protein with EAL and GGDEF domain
MKNDVWTLVDEPARAPAASPLLAAKVMMVDDEPLMTDLVQTHLEDAGYVNFVVTNDPRDALCLLHSERPGVLLLDLMMPQMSGFELLEAIRADAELRYMPVIVLTAATGADSKLRALQLGATDFLAKPVDASELVLRLRNTLAYHEYHNRLINFDPVTGLPNQRPFDRGIDEMLARADRCAGMAALLSIALPELRQLRESVDQAASDGVAKAIARRLERFAGGETAARGGGAHGRKPRVARLGPEQFGVLLDGLADAEAIEAAARRLLATVGGLVVVGPHEVAPKPWIGISVAPADGLTAEALRKGADLAATRAAAEGGVQYKFASHELNAKSYERFTLGLQLRGAAGRGQLRLHYQPKVDIASGRVVGAEALVRWQHPEHGLLPPGQFIGLAEELGLIRGIGAWVIERACLDAAEWERAGHRGLKIAVNVAKPQLQSGELGRVLRQAMFDSGLPAAQLVVELTESMLMDDVDESLALMHEMKQLGVTLALDDFGTGYSSLGYLKRFPIDELKIDRSFVVDLPARADVAIVQAVIDLGHSLGMSVTAEGVETDAQRSCLQHMGCDLYQGFLYSEPVPAERFAALLNRLGR